MDKAFIDGKDSEIIKEMIRLTEIALEMPLKDKQRKSEESYLRHLKKRLKEVYKEEV